jgi:hypothetical protein
LLVAHSTANPVHVLPVPSQPPDWLPLFVWMQQKVLEGHVVGFWPLNEGHMTPPAPEPELLLKPELLELVVPELELAPPELVVPELVALALPEVPPLDPVPLDDESWPEDDAVVPLPPSLPPSSPD